MSVASGNNEEAEYYRDDDNHNNSGSRTSDSGGYAKQTGDEGGDGLDMQQETRYVRGSKAMVYLVIFLAASAVGTVTYLYLKDAEESDFENDFRSIAKEVWDTVEFNGVITEKVLNDLSVAWTSYVGQSLVAEWPNVTLPHLEARAAELTRLSSIERVVFLPLVHDSEKEKWQSYAVESQGWIQDSLHYAGRLNVVPGRIPEEIYDPEDDQHDGHSHDDHSQQEEDHHDEDEHHHDEDELHDEDEHHEEKIAFQYSSLPIWQMGPAPGSAGVVMLDMSEYPWFQRAAVLAAESGRAILTEVVDLHGTLHDETIEEDGHDEHVHEDPHTVMIMPVYKSFEESEIAGYLLASIPWAFYFRNLLPERTQGVITYVNDGCGTEFTFQIDGPTATFLGNEKRHDHDYSHLAQRYEFASFSRAKVEYNDIWLETCDYRIIVYPSDALKETSSRPVLYACMVVLAFVFTALVLALYDYAVYVRQRKIMAAAKRTSAIVSSLFPKNVQERIMAEAKAQANQEKNKRGMNFAAKRQLKEFLGEANEAGTAISDGATAFKTKPIADLFLETTVMFADIVGFTAWSSTREPHQVFMLLENIYYAFDEIAKRRRVFKVETVGDCYVAVAGLPEPRKDHAVVMARFAHDCRERMRVLTSRMEEILGPDTADLCMRIGLHSGPVTAGVLRGERARFQLFGDTMNTTARMESNGMPNKIQVSQETADLLIGAGKGFWVTLRSEKIHAKGKGELTTYWLDVKSDAATSTSGSSESGLSDHKPSPKQDDMLKLDPSEAFLENGPAISARHQRLVNWNTDILGRLLKDVVARRGNAAVSAADEELLRELETKKHSRQNMVLDEVVDIITLPKFESMDRTQPESFELSDSVTEQLHEYVQTVSVLYRDNPFHNFEHVSHVTMSVVKLLSRIVAPDIDDDVDGMEQKLHDHTYGITSDLLTRFAVVFSALIHDVDHTGVPNSQLIKENASVAAAYKNKSVAEQNSVDIAWDLLMDSNFNELRRMIYTTPTEFRRFRQLVVNAVMATDIIDKDLGAARKARWNLAFADGYKTNSSESTDDVNRKATIVIEHLIQASDVAHTMQHWHIYRKWNTRLFEEMYRAYVNGRAEKDPSLMWYEGEKGFFDFYIIPLAKKLADCGVFGVSSDEYLNYAEQNRREWEDRGREVVAEMLQEMQKKYRHSTTF